MNITCMYDLLYILNVLNEKIYKNTLALIKIECYYKCINIINKRINIQKHFGGNTL